MIPMRVSFLFTLVENACDGRLCCYSVSSPFLSHRLRILLSRRYMVGMRTVDLNEKRPLCGLFFRTRRCFRGFLPKNLVLRNREFYYYLTQKFPQGSRIFFRIFSATGCFALFSFSAVSVSGFAEFVQNCESCFHSEIFC